VVAGDGVVSSLLAPLDSGVHDLEVVAVSRTSDTTRTAFTEIEGLDVGSIVIDEEEGDIVTVWDDGLVTARELEIPVQNTSEETRVVEVVCDLVSASSPETLTSSVVVTLAPGVSEVCTVPVIADHLLELGDGTVSVVGVTALACDPVLGVAEPAAEAVPLAELNATSLSFQNLTSVVENVACEGELVGDPSAVDRAFTIAGVAVEHGSSIDGVEYSIDGGTTWYSAQPTDGAWGEPEESYSIEASVETTGAYIVEVAPVSGGIRWDAGRDVGIEVTEDAQ
jgi:hypothetical protein